MRSLVGKKVRKGEEGEVMVKAKFLGPSLLLVLSALLMGAEGCAKQALQQPEAEKAAPMPDLKPEIKIEPKAVEILKASSRRLASARTMKFTAVVYYESPSRLGPALVYTTKSEVTLERPDKLRVITPYDGPASEFYYDGKRMMAYAPARNLAAVAGAPPTIDAALEAAYHSAAIYFPFTDVIVTDPYKDIAEGLTLAFYIGQSHVVGGITTDMVAYETGDTFVQIWIGAEDKLPRTARAVFRDDPLQLRQAVVFSDWQLDSAIPADAFWSSSAAKGKPIPFARPEEPPPGMRPPGERGPSKTR
jgi:hypothetical protein